MLNRTEKNRLKEMNEGTLLQEVVWLCDKQNLDAIKYLINIKKINEINLTDDMIIDSLFKKGNVEIIRLLAESKKITEPLDIYYIYKNKDITDFRDLKQLDIICINENIDLINYYFVNMPAELIKHKAPTLHYILKIIVKENKLELLDIILKSNNYISILDKFPYIKNELLFDTCENNNIESLKYLINSGADIHYNNDKLLKESIKNLSLETIKYLVEEEDLNIYKNQDVIVKLLTLTITAFFEEDFIESEKKERKIGLDIMSYFVLQKKIEITEEIREVIEPYKELYALINVRKLEDELENKNKENIHDKKFKI